MVVVRGWEKEQRNLVLARGTAGTTLEPLIHVNCRTRSMGWSFLSVSLAPWETTQGGKENLDIMTPEPAMDFRL